jgi:hypothetical protein
MGLFQALHARLRSDRPSGTEPLPSRHKAPQTCLILDRIGPDPNHAHFPPLVPEERDRVYTIQYNTKTKHKFPGRNCCLLAAPVHARALFSSTESALGSSLRILSNRQAGFITTLSASRRFTHRLESDRPHLERVSLVPKPKLDCDWIHEVVRAK